MAELEARLGLVSHIDVKLDALDKRMGVIEDALCRLPEIEGAFVVHDRRSFGAAWIVSG